MTRFQLTIEAEKLSRVSALRRGHPYAVVTVTGGPRDCEVLGQTEAMDSQDPRWTKVIYVETDASRYLPISVQIFDKQDGREDRKMAEATFEVTAIHQAPVHSQYEEMDGTMYVSLPVRLNHHLLKVWFQMLHIASLFC